MSDTIKIPKRKKRNTVHMATILDGTCIAKIFRHRADRRSKDSKNSWRNEWEL